MKRIIRVVTLLMLLICITALTTFANQAGQPAPHRLDSSAAIVVSPLDHVEQLDSIAVEKSDYLLDAQGNFRVIVELNAPSIVERQLVRRGAVALTADAVAAEEAVILDGQQALLDNLFASREGISAEFHHTLLVNAISIAVPRDVLAQLSTHPDVKAVYPELTYAISDNAFSLDELAVAMPTSVRNDGKRAGEGIKIAIIDSGIEPSNAMFSGDDFIMPSGYPKGDCIVNAINFCNGKIIAARWYGVNGAVPDDANANEVASPQDRTGHGSHVAGIAAGNRVEFANTGDGVARDISGIAADAYLMAYKACWNGAGCFASGLLAALSDAVLDGADVINNSWGGGPGNDPNNSPFRTAIENTVAAGVPVVFSTGNNGSDPGTITCPACIEEAIAVANLYNSVIHANEIAVYSNGNKVGTYAMLPSVETAQDDFPAEDLGINYAGTQFNNNEDLCEREPGLAFFNRVMVARRGGCSFEVKALHASEMSVSALLIINDVGGPPIAFSRGELATYDIPVFMISLSEGEDMLTKLQSNSERVNISAIKRIDNANWGSVVATNSSRGPNGDLTVLKPDVAAIGTFVVSADTFANGGTGFAFDSGTSMAAPRVAGTLALALQTHPTWTPTQLKSAVMSTAMPNGLLDSDGATAADPFDRGAGTLQILRASNNLVAATMAAASHSNPACADVCVFNNVITNVTTGTLRFDAAEIGTVTQVIPSEVTLAAGESAEFSIRIDLTDEPANTWLFPEFLWVNTDPDGGEVYRVPLAVKKVASGPEDVFEKSAETKGLLQFGDIFTYTLRLTNPNAGTTTFDISDPLPDTVEYVDGSVSSNGEYDPVGKVISADVTLPPAVQFSQLDLGGFIGIAQPSVQLICNGDCDDEWLRATGFDFTYFGKQYDTIYISSNGLISLEEPTISGNTPMRLPSSTLPNGVIAPLWSDYNLLGDDGDTVGGGKIYGAKVTLDGSEASYNVIEWKDVEHFGSSDGNPVVHSFQLWIQRGTNYMWFTYGGLTGFAEFASTIGAENVSGEIGATAFHKANLGSPNEGTLPETTADTFLANDGTATVAFTVKAQSGLFIDNTAFANSGSSSYRASVRVMAGNRLYLPLLVGE